MGREMWWFLQSDPYQQAQSLPPFPGFGLLEVASGSSSAPQPMSWLPWVNRTYAMT